MKKTVHPILGYLIVCVMLFVLAELSPFSIGPRFYRFDRAHVFLALFYLTLFVMGIGLRLHHSSSWPRTVLVGALSGSISGLIAQALMVVINGIIYGFLISESASDLVFSMLMGSLFFLTPVWGIVSAALTKLLAERKEHAAVGPTKTMPKDR